MTTHFFEGLEPPTVDTVEANILHIPYTTQWEPFIFWAASQLVPSFKIWTLVIFKPTRRHWNKQWPTLAREMFRASWNFSLKKHLTQTVLKCITPNDVAIFQNLPCSGWARFAVQSDTCRNRHVAEHAAAPQGPPSKDDPIPSWSHSQRTGKWPLK